MRALVHLPCCHLSYLLPNPITYCQQLGRRCQGAVFPASAITRAVCENGSSASPRVSAPLPSARSPRPVKSNGVRSSSPLLSTASFQPDSLKLPYPQNSKRSSSKTLCFVITWCIPACQGLIGKTAKPAFRLANCCRRGTSTPCAVDNYFLPQQFWVFQGVRFYKNRLSPFFFFLQKKFFFKKERRRHICEHSPRSSTF